MMQQTNPEVRRVLVGAPMRATFVVGAEAGDAINVVVQLQDALGNDLAVRGAVLFYLASDAAGDAPHGTAPSAGIAIGTDGAMIEWTTNLSGLLISESDGDIDITLSEAGVATWYLVIVTADGRLWVSGAITFA